MTERIIAPAAGEFHQHGDELYNLFDPAGTLGLDVETNGLIDRTLRTIQLAPDPDAVVLDVADPDQLHFARDILSEPTRRFVSHTGIDPRVIWESFGIDITGRSLDTWTNACLLDPSTIATHALKPLCTQYLSDPRLQELSDQLAARFKELQGPRPPKPPAPTKTKSAKPQVQAAYLIRVQKHKEALTQWQQELAAWEAYEGWRDIPVTDPLYTTYGGMDAIMARRLFFEQLQLLQDKGVPRHTILAEQRFYQICLRMGYIHGMKVDTDYARNVALGEHERTYERCRSEFLELTGFVTGSPAVGPWLESLGVEFPVRTPTGAPSLKKRDLERAHSVYLSTDSPSPIAIRAMELKAQVADVSNYVTFTRNVLERERGGRIYPTFKALGAETGRMSATDPPVQTIKGSVTRGIFIPDSEDEVLVSIDLSQIEPRIAAAEAGETALIERLKDGWDVYNAAAEMSFGPNFTKRQRTGIKRTILATLYSGGIDVIITQLRLLDNIIMTREEVEEIRGMWFSIAPRIRKLGWDLAKLPQVVLPSGRIVPVQKGREYKNLNSLIQGTARDVLRDTIFRVEDAGYGSRLRNLIHDEGLFSLRRDTLAEDIKTLRSCFEVDYKGVPVVSEVEVYTGGRWGHGTEIWTG